MKAGLNQAENEERARKTTHGMKEAALQGYWPWRAPLGYRNHRTSDGKPSMRPDNETARFIGMAFEMFASGKHTQTAVHEAITARGLRSATGKPLTRQALRKILATPVYAGFSENALAKKRVQGRWPAIVDADTFEVVQGLLAGPMAGPNHNIPRLRHRDEFPLRGLGLNQARFAG